MKTTDQSNLNCPIVAFEPCRCLGVWYYEQAYNEISQLRMQQRRRQLAGAPRPCANSRMPDERRIG